MSELNGRRIIQLPEKTTEIVELEFSPEERVLYDGIERRARIKVNKWLKKGNLVKTWSCALALLVRQVSAVC
jgi:hypothetical protein